MVGGYEGGWVATTITNLRWDDKSSPLTYLKDESVSFFALVAQLDITTASKLWVAG